MKRMLTTLSAACLTLAGFAQFVDLWRGETTAFQLDDNVELDLSKAPPWMKVRVGSARPVKYLTEPQGMQYAEALDKVVWGDTTGAHRWVEISVPENAKPGLRAYSLGEGVCITIVDQVLPPPSQWKYYLDLWQHPWAVARYFNVKPFSPEHYAKMEPVWRLLATAGQKVITTTLVDLPWCHQCYDGYRSMIGRTRVKAKGEGEGYEWKFDYTLFDEYVAFCRKCGLGPDIGCYSMCPWACRVDWKDENGKVCKETAAPGTPFFEEYWGPFLEDFGKHLKEKGWFNHTYMAMDERDPEDLRKIVALIAKKAPGFKTSMAGNRKPSDFKGIRLDSYSQFLAYMTPEFLTEVSERRRDGMVTTVYVCCGGYPNTFLSSKAGEGFWLGAYPAFAGFDGFLRWAWNSWPKNPDVDASFSPWQAGDTFFAYPDGNPSIRFLDLRRGIVAAEKLRILRETGRLDRKGYAELKKMFLARSVGLVDLRNRVSRLSNGVAPQSFDRADLRIRDPFVVTDKAAGKYYLIEAKPWSGGDGVNYFESTNLVEWGARKVALKLPKDVKPTAVWAPEAHEYKGKWYVFATLTFPADPAAPIQPMPCSKDFSLGPLQPRGTWIFKADKPTGPYAPLSAGSVTPKDWMCLDGTLYVEDGKPYMVFCHEWCQTADGQMAYVPLKDDLSGAAGEPVTLFRASEGWKGASRVTDGCFMYRSPKSGKLFMIWSNFVADRGYSVLLAESQSGKIAGPWIQRGPISPKNGGHAMIFRKLDGNLAITFHSPDRGPFERMQVRDLVDKGDTLEIR